MPFGARLAAIAEAGGLGFHEGFAREPPPAGAGIVRVGMAGDLLPTEGLDAFDILVTSTPNPPAPWVYAPAPQAVADQAHGAFARQPLAAVIACQVLRMSLQVSFADALVLESLAYSMLLSSAGFAEWRAANPPRQRQDDDTPRVTLDRAEGGALVIRLSRPAARNAVDARMRDALCEALAFAADDPDQPPVRIEGEGPSFSAGGDLAEFGTAGDPAAAHAVRTLRSAAAGIAAIAPRVTARLHGACIGAGIEIPAAAGRVIAAPDARLRLPEVGMGLIPGAGGTATIPRRIGRHRTVWMALGGLDIDADTALGWGLVDAIETP